MTVPKRFGVLRFFGTLLKVIAWIVLVVSILLAIGAVVAGGWDHCRSLYFEYGLDLFFRALCIG